MVLVYIYVALACYNTEYLTLPMSSIENIVDDAANVAVLDKTGNVKGKNNKGQPPRMGSAYNELESHSVDWKNLWSEGTDAVMDVPIGGVCEILYGQ